MIVAVKPNQTFKLRHRGYDIIEVDSFIRAKTEDLALASAELDKTKQMLAELQAKYETLQQDHQVLVQELTVREKAAEEITRIALKEANIVVETAQKNADSIVKESLQTARQILVEMSNLGNEAIYLRRDVKKKMERLADVIKHFTLPRIPSLDCLDLIDEDENVEEDTFRS